MDCATVSSPATETSSSSSSVNRRGLAIGLCAVILGIAFEAAAVATAMPAAAEELDGLTHYAWAFSLFMIGMLFSTVVGGALSDRIGPAKPLIVGMLIFAGGLVIAGTAVSWPMLIAGRLVQGLGSGAMNTAAYVCIAQVFDARQRPRMFTYISMAWVLPGIAGPAVAAWITHQLSWHFAFYAVLPLLAFGSVMMAPTLRRLLNGTIARPAGEAADSPTSSRDSIPLWIPAGVAALSAAAIQYAGQRLDLIGVIPAVIGLAGLAFALPRLMPPGFLRLARGLSAVVLTRMLLPGAFMGAEAFLPLMLVELHGLSLNLAGATLSIGSIGWFGGAWLQSRSWLRLRREHLVTVGAVSVASGVALVAVTVLLPNVWIGVVAVAWIIAAFGMGVGTASTSVATMALSADAEQGRNASSLNLGDALGAGIFVGISGSVFGALLASGNLAFTFGVAFATMAVVGVLAVLASLRIGRLPTG